MPRPPRPGLTSQPSERDELLTAARGQLHAGHHQQQREAATVAMDEVGSVVVNPAIGQHHEGAEENDLLDERSSLLGGKNENCRKLPWYRQAHPVYMHIIMFVMALGMGLLAAAKIEQFTQTICSQINEDTMLAHPELDQDRLLPILLLTPEQCRHSTEVQKKVAQLNLCINVIMGLSCIVTTPFWGSLSDRIGRKLCIVLNTMSFVLGDLILIVVLAFPQKVSYWWILLYPLLEGIFGGMGGGQSIMAAYIGDCTGAGSRAGTFSIMMGVVFGGIAIGPAIGSFTIQISNNPIMPFYAAFVVHSIQTLISMFIMPESLSKEKQYNARRVHAEKKEQNAEAVREAKWTAEREGYGFLKRVGIALKAWCRPVVNVFAPLALLGPTKKADGSQDWSLPVLCLTTGFYSMMMSMYSVKMQYAQLKFGWSSIQLGNFLSLMGATRIVALVVAIPLFIKLIRKPHEEPFRQPAPDNDAETSSLLREERRNNVNASGFSKVEDDEWEDHKKHARIVHDYKFDLRLARISILIDTLAYTALCFTHTVTQFIVFVMLQALGSGANPALSSLCLMFADPNETGSLMGAISVLQIIFAQVIGPVLFNGVYASTVDTWPEAFFLLGASTFFITFVCLLFVRVRRPKWNGYSTEGRDDQSIHTEVTA